MSEEIDSQQSTKQEQAYKGFAIIANIKSSWREIISLLVFGLGFGFLSDWVTQLGLVLGDVTGFAFLDRTLKGFSNYAAIVAAGGIIGLALWPTISKFGFTSFGDEWAKLDGRTKLIIYVSVYFASAIVAAIAWNVK